MTTGTRRYSFISDIHANLPALDAVLADIATSKSSETYHLGDLVGYAPWPNETVARIREYGIAGVAGNYDSTVATDYKHCGCKAESAREEELSHISYAWTCTTVSAETKRFLGSLPFRIDLKPLGGHAPGPALFLLHATPVSNLVYVTEDRPDSFLSKMAGQAGAKAGDVICFGHTHKPWYREVAGIMFVNTGSVGRPKDGDCRASYAFLEISDRLESVEIVRVPYDVEAVAHGIAESGLPSDFAFVLRNGANP